MKVLRILLLTVFVLVSLASLGMSGVGSWTVYLGPKSQGIAKYEAEAATLSQMQSLAQGGEIKKLLTEAADTIAGWKMIGWIGAVCALLVLALLVVVIWGKSVPVLVVTGITTLFAIVAMVIVPKVEGSDDPSMIAKVIAIAAIVAAVLGLVTDRARRAIEARQARQAQP